MKTAPFKFIWVIAVALASACGSDTGDDIVDIGKTCVTASDCEHVCVGTPEGARQCSLACETSSDCPSFMDCIESSSTGERRCFDPGGLITRSPLRHCEVSCDDVGYFCSSGEISELEVQRCVAWCQEVSDSERDGLAECVNAAPRYTSACPASSCVLDRI